jgi:uncharacterized protein YfiM (DUF2279 family)
MKCRRLVAMLMLFAAPATGRAQAIEKPPRRPDPIVGVDKVKHFFIAGFIESMTFAGSQAIGADRRPAKVAAIGVTAAFSIGREVHDLRTKGQFSFRDLAWDALGAVGAILVINRTGR